MKTDSHKMNVNDHLVYTEKYIFTSRVSTLEYPKVFDEEALIEGLHKDLEDQILEYAKSIEERRNVV